jgi:hypothetical protein
VLNVLDEWSHENDITIDADLHKVLKNGAKLAKHLASGDYLGGFDGRRGVVPGTRSGDEPRTDGNR